MRIELLTGQGNVVRFPVERRARPTLELLRSIAPDGREVLQIAESFQLPLAGVELRSAADEEMAEYILNHVRPEPGTVRQSELDALLAPVISTAVDMCRKAHDAALVATHAQERVVRAQVEGASWIEPLVERADELITTAAQLLIEAHQRFEAAEGAARAVRIAKCGETWTLRSAEADMRWLLDMPQSVNG